MEDLGRGGGRGSSKFDTLATSLTGKRSTELARDREDKKEQKKRGNHQQRKCVTVSHLKDHRDLPSPSLPFG